MTAPAVCNPWVRCDSMKVAVRLFAGLRELAGTRATEIELSPGSTAADVWPALELGAEPPGLLLAVNKSYATRDTVLAGGRRGRADPARLGWRVPPLGGAAVGRRCRSRGRVRRCGSDRHVHRDDPRALTRARGRAARVRGVRGHGGGRDGADRRRPRASGTRSSRRDPPPGRRRRDRRDERRDRGLLGRTGRALSPPAPRRSTR